MVCAYPELFVAVENGFFYSANIKFKSDAPSA